MGGRLLLIILLKAVIIPFESFVTCREYIRSCEELWQKGLYVELGAYQHHVFMDWRFVDDSNWGLVNSNLNGAGVESMQVKWEEMFGEKEEINEKEEEVAEEGCYEKGG